MPNSKYFESFSKEELNSEYYYKQTLKFPNAWFLIIEHKDSYCLIRSINFFKGKYFGFGGIDTLLPKENNDIVYWEKGKLRFFKYNHKYYFNTTELTTPKNKSNIDSLINLCTFWETRDSLVIKNDLKINEDSLWNSINPFFASTQEIFNCKLNDVVRKMLKTK